MLRLGGNADNTRMVIAAAFQKQKSMEDVAALLQNTFHGGNGFKTPEGELSVWYAVDGIHIAPGRSAEYVRTAQVIAWQDAAVRISELMDSGAYASNMELTEAGQHERMQLAQALWYLKHDLSDEAREQGYRRGPEQYPGELRGSPPPAPPAPGRWERTPYRNGRCPARPL